MKVTKYIIECEQDAVICITCRTEIGVDEVSFEFRPERGTKCTKEELQIVYCEKCVPKDAKVYKGTQLLYCYK